MPDIPGFKNIRLLAQKPVPMWTGLYPRVSNALVHTMEVTFIDDSIVNVKLDEETYSALRARMLAQPGTAIEERMAARSAVVLKGEQKEPVQEQVLPLDATGHQIHEALVSVSRQNAPDTTRRDRTLQSAPSSPIDTQEEVEDDEVYDTEDYD